MEGKVIPSWSAKVREAAPSLLFSISMPVPMARPADGVLLGVGHLLLRATWTACGSTCFPWPSGPSGVVWPLEAETTAVCHLTPRAQSSLLFPLGTERESKLMGRASLPWDGIMPLPWTSLRTAVGELRCGKVALWMPCGVLLSAQGPGLGWDRVALHGFRGGWGYLAHKTLKKGEQTWKLAWRREGWERF